MTVDFEPNNVPVISILKWLVADYEQPQVFYVTLFDVKKVIPTLLECGMKLKISM